MNGYIERAQGTGQLTIQDFFGYNWKGERIIESKNFIDPMVSTDQRCINSCWCYDKDPLNYEWSQNTIYIRDEGGQILAEFDMDIRQDGSKG